MHRKITILPDISVTVTGREPITFSFAQFVNGRLDDEQFFGRSLPALESRISIRRAFEGRAPGDVVELREDDWSLLAASIQTPSRPYIPALTEQILPFFYAVTKAGA